MRRVVYVLNLLLGAATHGCELASFGSYRVVPDNPSAPGARIEREPDNSQSKETLDDPLKYHVSHEGVIFPPLD